MVAREVDQFSGARDDSTHFRRAGHGDTAPAPELQQTLIAKDSQGSKDSVGVDVEDRREVSRRWQTLTTAGLAVSDGTPEFRGDLVMQRDRFFGGQLDTQHGAR